MNKDIFDAALELFDPVKKLLYYSNHYINITQEEIDAIKKALKLGKLYKELSKLIVAVPLFEGSKMICYKTKYRNDIKYTKILNKIKELENEKNNRI